MSHGGGESECVHKRLSKRNLSRRNDEFAHSLAKISVAQICESTGFESFQQSALDALCDVALRYLRNSLRSAQSYANMAGRSEYNTFDFIQSLEELSSAQGFTSVSNVDSCLSRCGPVKEILQFVSDSEIREISHSSPLFPVRRQRKLVLSFLDTGKEPPGNHIPSWLPAFPDSSVVERKEERSMLDLGLQQICSTSNGAMGKEAQYVNPFIAAPLPFGTKEVSELLPPSKIVPGILNGNMEPNSPNPAKIDPALESAEEEEQKNSQFVYQRPPVYFKLAGRKKALAKSSERKDIERKKQWYISEEKSKKKAEKILKQSLEIVEELAQL